MAVKVVAMGEPDDCEIFYDPQSDRWSVKVWDEQGKLLKIGGPYKTEQGARTAERRMMGF